MFVWLVTTGLCWGQMFLGLNLTTILVVLKPFKKKTSTKVWSTSTRNLKKTPRMAMPMLGYLLSETITRSMEGSFPP